jgi:ADP-heptose:LPS heptosyltransferase
MPMRNFLRHLDHLRRDHTQGLTRWLFKQIGRDRHLVPNLLPASEVKQIMVLRDNKRIGNMYFMLPFLRELRQAYPDAKIDLMLIDAHQASIFDYLGLNQIFISNFSFYSIPQFLRTLLRCRKTVYDLVIMPHRSASDTLIGGFLRAKNKVAFWGPETVAVFPHAFRVEQRSNHAARSALTLLQELGHPTNHPDHHRMAFSSEEMQKGEEVVRALRGNAGLCVGYFRGARGNKVISNTHWHEIRRKFDQASDNTIQWLEILSPDIEQPLIAGTPTYASADLRELAAVTRSLDLFICGDTGPLHLADAAGARCLGLFTATSIEHYGCLGQTCTNLSNIEQLDPFQILGNLALHGKPEGAPP